MEYRDIIQRVWSDWSIGEKLGEGSFGQVYFVQKERLGVIQKAAVKVVRIPKSDAEVEEIKAAYGLAEEQLKEFFYPEVLKYKEEIQLMQTLGENANIVQVQIIIWLRRFIKERGILRMWIYMHLVSYCTYC